MIDTIEKLQSYFPRYTVTPEEMDNSIVVFLDRQLNKREVFLTQSHGLPSGMIATDVTLPLTEEDITDRRYALAKLLKDIRHGTA